MGKYSLDWSVTCPKCDKVITPDMLECGNCGKGKIKVGVFNGDRKELGCDKCVTAIESDLHCPSCNARIAGDLIQVIRPSAIAEQKAIKTERKSMNEILYAAWLIAPMLFILSELIGWLFSIHFSEAYQFFGWGGAILWLIVNNFFVAPIRDSLQRSRKTEMR